MISFQSENLKQKIYKNDDIDIDLHLTAEKLDYIFKEYLYFTTSQAIGDDGWVQFNYELRTDKVENLYTDQNLGAVLIYWLSIHYIQDILNASTIRMVSNVNNPDVVYLYFDQELNSASYAMLSVLEKDTEFITDHMYGVRSIKHDSIEINNEDKPFMMTHTKFNQVKRFDNSIVVINENFITENDVEQAIDHIFVATTDGGAVVPIVPEEIKKATRFAYNIKIHGNSYVILFSTNYNNYIIGNRLKEIFKLMDTKINRAIQEWKEVSYLYRIDAPFASEPQWFIQNYQEDPDFVEGIINISNEYLSDWCKTKYGKDNDLIFDFTVDYAEAVSEIKKNIFQYIDDIGKGIAYFDFDASMVHAIIGDLDDYNYLGIYGYDEENQRPIILGINKDYESGGSWFRPIKIVSGGITAINNDELKNDITSADYDYLLNTTLVDVDHIHFMDMISMINDVYGLSGKKPKEFTAFNPLDSERKFFFNENEYDAEASTINGWVYKQSKSVALDSTAEGIELQTFTMKSFIIDCQTNHNNSNQMKVGHFKFYLGETDVTPDYADITETVSSDGQNFNQFRYACSTSNMSDASGHHLTWQQTCRRIVQFANEITFDRIEFRNWWQSYTQYRKYGIKKFELYISDVDYDNPNINEIEGLTTVYDGSEGYRNYQSDLGYDLYLVPDYPAQPTVYSAKSVILDIESNQYNADNTYGVGLNGIKFWLDDDDVTPDQFSIIEDSVTAYNETGQNPNNEQREVFGSSYNDSHWIHESEYKIRCVATFKQPVLFDRVTINNYSVSWVRAVKSAKLYISDFQWQSWNYGSGTAIATLIWDGDLNRRWYGYYEQYDELWMIPIDFGNTSLKKTQHVTLLDTGCTDLEPADALSYAIPYDAIIDLFTNVSSELEMDEFLTKWFWVEGDGNDFSFDGIEYNNLFLKYIPILSGHSMYKTSHQNSVVGFRMINEQLLSGLSFEVKHEILENLQKDTKNPTIYKFLQGTNAVTVINDDSEFNANSDQPKGIFKNGTDVIETHSLANSKQSEFLSMLMHENVYHSKIERPSGSYICGLFKLRDVAINSYNQSIIFNKVIGSDWYSYYSLKSDGNDITFSGYFVSSYTDNHFAWQLLDLDNSKIKSLSTTPFEFNAGITNPIITNMEVIENQELYVVDKDKLDIITNNWLNIFKIYDILPQYKIEYARKPYDNDRNQVFNVYSNEWVMVKEV